MCCKQRYQNQVQQVQKLFFSSRPTTPSSTVYAVGTAHVRGGHCTGPTRRRPNGTWSSQRSASHPAPRQPSGPRGRRPHTEPGPRPAAPGPDRPRRRPAAGGRGRPFPAVRCAPPPPPATSTRLLPSSRPAPSPPQRPPAAPPAPALTPR